MTRRLLLAGIGWVLCACAPDRTAAPIFGDTMGTQYGVQFATPMTTRDRAAIIAGIDADLARIDKAMSNWRDDSEVSGFNAHHDDSWFPVSAETAQVVAAALGISSLSNGAFDITAAPLVDAWGFGAGLPARSMPTQQAISAAMESVGWRLLEVRLDPPALRKRHDRLRIDLSAIAKGFAVDVISKRLSASGVGDFLVEIGGELCARGLSPGARPWTVAIEAPDDSDELPALLRPGHRCAATSGDYRNFFELDGRRFAHIIDPRHGWPVSHELVSVTVVADDAMTADAWATALIVLGPEAGAMLAERLSTAAYFVRRTDPGYQSSATKAFARFEYTP